jgi:hypothetical protein
MVASREEAEVIEEFDESVILLAREVIRLRRG